MYTQLDILKTSDSRPPQSVSWNLWHGCSKASTGCKNCYMYTRDLSVGKDPTDVKKTQVFNLPTRILRSGPHKGKYKIPPGSSFDTCFTSDFFHPNADEWRPDAWDMIRERSDCTFFMITKRPERIADHLPHDWNDGWEHVRIAVTCEDQHMVNRRMPIYIQLPLKHKSVAISPMLSSVNLRSFLPHIETVAVGGESGINARPCNYSWVLDVHMQCVDAGVHFLYHQTGAKLIKGGKMYNIPRRYQHQQAKLAGIDFDGEKLMLITS